MDTKKLPPLAFSHLGGLISFFILSFCLSIWAQQGKPGDQRMKNIIPGLNRISVEDTYEGKPILSFQEILRHLGTEESEGFLAGISGEAFVFSYKDAQIDEPQREHWPHDIFARAARELGYSLEWIVEQPSEEVKRIVREQIDQGYPVLTHSLDESSYHGFQIIVGYDFEKEIFYLQTADRHDHQDYVEAPIPEEWIGAVPGPLFWVHNPLGLIAPDPDAGEFDRRQIVLRAMQRAVELWEMESFPFAAPGEDKSWVPWTGGLDLNEERAPISAAAYAAVERDITRMERLEFPLVWRIDAQFCRLIYIRKDAARFLEEVESLFSSASREEIAAAAALFKEVSEGAADFFSCFWNRDLHADPPEERAALLQRIDASSALVMWLPESVTEEEMVGRPDFRFSGSPWGNIVIVDTPERRQHAISLLHQLKVKDEKAFGLLRKIASDNRLEEAD